MNSNTFFVVDDQSISSTQVLEYLQSSGQVSNFLSIVLRQHAIAKSLENFEIFPTAEIVQNCLTEFCEKQAINGEEQLDSFLKEKGVTYSELQRRLASDWAIAQLVIQISEPLLQDYFISERSKLDKLSLSCIELDGQGLAEELLDQLTEEQASFEDLAKTYSLSSSRKNGGRLAPIYRGNLPEELNLAMGNAHPGELIGPLEMGERWYLYRLEETISASLEGELETELRSAIFEEQLMKEISQMDVKFQVTQWQYLQTSTH